MQFEVQIPSYPVVFFNLSGYDAHLFIRELGAHISEMGVILKNKEDYISFSIKVPVEKYIDMEGNEKNKLIELRNCLVLRITLSYNTACLPEKEFILMSTLIPGIDLTRPSFLHRCVL